MRPFLASSQRVNRALCRTQQARGNGAPHSGWNPIFVSSHTWIPLIRCLYIHRPEQVERESLEGVFDARTSGGETGIRRAFSRFGSPDGGVEAQV